MMWLVFTRKASVLVGLIAMILLLAACGGSTSSHSPTSPTKNAAVTATAPQVVKLITLVGPPTAKMLSGTTFDVVGQVKNGDDKQHDITLQATLLDASGIKIATATQLVDNVAGGATVAYTISGTTPQPTWKSVQVTVLKVSENIDGSGSD